MLTIFVIALEKKADHVLRSYMLFDIFLDFFYVFCFVEMFGNEDEGVLLYNVVIGCK